MVKGKEKNYFAALYNVSKVINASLDPSHVLSEIVKSVATTMDVKGCSIRLLSSRKTKLLMGAIFGLSEDYIHKGPIIVKESGVDQKVLKGKTIFIKDVQTDKDFQYRAKAKAEGIKSILVVPLKVGKKVIGVLRVYTSHVYEFGVEDVQFLEAAANLSAIALDNARLHKITATNYDLLLAHKYRIDDN
jgi:signal transduction protein with GAF and PtsI domain